MRYHILVPEIYPISLKESERLLPSCVHCHFCLCELVCVCVYVCVWSLGFYYTWFSPLSQSIFLLIFKLATSCISCLGFYFYLETQMNSLQPQKASISFSLAQIFFLSQNLPFQGKPSVSCLGSEVSQVAHLASWNTYVILTQININKYISSTLQNWNH